MRLAQFNMRLPKINIIITNSKLEFFRFIFFYIIFFCQNSVEKVVEKLKFQNINKYFII